MPEYLDLSGSLRIGCSTCGACGGCLACYACSLCAACGPSPVAAVGVQSLITPTTWIAVAGAIMLADLFKVIGGGEG